MSKYSNMRHSIFTLPALLRPTLLLAAASQSTFSVQDDLLAFPQYEIKFSEAFIPEALAQSRLGSNEPLLFSEGRALSGVDHYQPLDSRAGKEGKKEEVEKIEYERMILDGQPYLCSIPQVSKPEEKADGNDALSRAEEEKELARATDRGWELLSGMEGNCVYYISGWWSYRFCYNEGVRQFHQLPPSRGVPVYPPVEDPGVDGYTLGAYSSQQQVQSSAVPKGAGGEYKVQSALDGGGLAKTKASSPGSGELVQRGESRYLVQKLDGGTKCDLTGKERKVEVQFHCNQHPSDRISLIKETSTCAYLMVIQTPRLCNDVAFLPPQKDQPNTVICSPILAEDQIDDYKRDLQALKAAETEAKVWEATTDAAKVFLGEDSLQIVGDIIVGSHSIVPDDVKLEKSAIVGGGKETYIDTVASSDGKILSKEDIQKLGLGDPKSVEKLRKELERIAQGQDWKLDVIDTPRGREYRGIIGTEGDEEDEKLKKKEDESEPGSSGREGSKEEYFNEEL